MNPRLLETKFHIPAWRPGGVVRPRLRERLHRGLQECRKLTLISAPAGYGKTTLMAEWIATKEAAPFVKIAWLSLEETDNDPAHFFQYWLAALHHVDHTLGQDLQNLLEMPQMPPPTTILAELINDLAALPYLVVLVLDDYHTIQAQLIHAALEFVLEHQPHNLRRQCDSGVIPGLWSLPLQLLSALGYVVLGHLSDPDLAHGVDLLRTDPQPGRDHYVQ